jgi:protein TonB
MTYALDMIAQQRVRAVRWTLATVIVVSAHVGAGAYALMRNTEDLIEEDNGSPVMMELAPLAVASPVDSPDLAHGPLQEEAVTTPPTTEKAPEKTFADIPPVEQAPLAPEPEVVLPTPDPIKEKKVEEEKKAEEPAPEKQEKVDPAVGAPLTTAPPRVEAPPAPPAAANAAGTAARPATVPLSWQKQLISHLNRFKRYPDAARARPTWRHECRFHDRPQRTRDGSPGGSGLRLDSSRRRGDSDHPALEPNARAAARHAGRDLRSRPAGPVPNSLTASAARRSGSSDEPDEQEHDQRAEKCGHDVAAHRFGMDAQARRQKARDAGAEDADHDVADEAVAVALDEDAGEPAGDGADDDPGNPRL